MRSRLLFLLPLALALALITTPGIASAAPSAKPKKGHHHHKKKKKKPTEAQKIAKAVAAAEHSPGLWATINVCTSTPSQDTVGVRGQMPSLGLPATLLMNVTVSYWNYSDNMFEPVSGAVQAVSLGTGTRGLHQGGVNFPFSPPTAGTQFLVRGAITFEWKVRGRVVGKVTRNTGHGYANVSDSNPPGLSEGSCTLT